MYLTIKLLIEAHLLIKMFVNCFFLKYSRWNLIRLHSSLRSFRLLCLQIRVRIRRTLRKKFDKRNTVVLYLTVYICMQYAYGLGYYGLLTE
jgi:hypothetical protein